MKIIAQYFKLFFLDCQIKISRAMMYRSDFFIGILTTFVFSFIAPLFQLFIYSRTNGYPGWNLNEIILFQSVLLFWTGLSESIFVDLKRVISAIVASGNFDRFLLLPYSPIFMLLTKGFDWKPLGTLLAGFSGIIYTSIKLNISFSIVNFILFFISIFFGLILYIAFLIIFCTIAIRLINVERLREIFDKITMFSNYPAEVYTHTIKFIYLSVLPIGLWIYYPASALLGRFNSMIYVGIISSIMLLILSIIFWNHQLKKHTSAGG